MNIDDDTPKQRPGGFGIGEDLSALSVDELRMRITLLEDEIARIRSVIQEKQSSKDAADTFFKS